MKIKMIALLFTVTALASTGYAAPNDDESKEALTEAAEESKDDLEKAKNDYEKAKKEGMYDEVDTDNQNESGRDK